MSRRLVILLGLLLAYGCGTGIDPLAFESVAGTYSASFISTEPSGDEFAADFELVITQSEGSLTGSWVIDGVINGRTNSTADGAFAATLPQGPNPSFSASLAYSFCPQDLMTFTATYSSSSGTLTLVGGLDIPDSQCNVLTTYPIEVSLAP